jgi:hypothetical protein
LEASVRRMSRDRISAGDARIRLYAFATV